MKYRYIGLLSTGHMVTDLNQGALPAMLPFFISAFDLSYAAADIIFAANMTSSIIQPVFGHAADRFSMPWLLSAGLMLAGGGAGLAGIVPGYGWILCMAIVSGIGIAAYHPEAARRVNFAAGAMALTVFSGSGIIGSLLGGSLADRIGPRKVMLRWGVNPPVNKVTSLFGVSFGRRDAKMCVPMGLYVGGSAYLLTML